MNTQHPDHFDATLRATWRDAADHLPGPLRLQLSPNIAMQRTRKKSAQTRWWLPAAGAFASMALAVGLWWSPSLRQHAPTTPLATTAEVAADTAAVAVNDDDAASELLTRNPDFYAWLGTDEARSLAME